MKKFKHLPTILMLVLCLVALTIGVYAIQHTQNRIIGSVTIKASNPAVKLTMYYVPNDTTVEEAVQNDANKIGKTKTARYGVELDLTDDRLNFGMTGVNVLEDVKTKTIAIKIENPSDKVLGAYFADQSNISKVKTTTTLSTYTSKTSFTEENLVDDDYARADFSDYTQVPAKEGETNGQAIVTMSISLLDLTLVELYIKVDTAFIIEDYDAGKGEINLQTDPHLAVNVTAEDYESVPTALSTTDTTIDAEVYNISGAYVGLVNMQYSDATATALSAKQKNGYVKPLGAVPLAGETVTFSFNYSVTASDGTVTTAENIFTDEKASEGLVGIGIGNYNGFAGLLPTLMTGGATQLTKGEHYTVSGSTITITYSYSEPLNFCIVHETSEGMKINISKTSSSTNLSLITLQDKRVEAYVPLGAALVSVPTSTNMIIGDQSLGVLPVRAFKTTTENPSFMFAIVVGDFTLGIEYFSQVDLMAMLIKGSYSDATDFYSKVSTGAIPNTDMLTAGTDYSFDEANVILNPELITEDYFDFTLVYTTIPGYPLYTAGGNGENVFSLYTKVAVPVYEDYVRMNGGDAFTYTFEHDPTEISKDENGELDGIYVSLSKIMLKNIPDTEALDAVIISTDAEYETIFIVEQALFDMGVSQGMTLLDLYSVLDVDPAEIGMYVSVGTPTENGTEFEIFENFLTNGEKAFVLIMATTEDKLSSNLTTMVSFDLSLKTITDPLIYTLSDDGTYYSVTGSYITLEEIEVPATNNNLPVKAIASGAFQDSSVTTLNLSEATNLTTIGSSAFSGCTSLTTVNLSGATNLTTIESSAFSGCTGLASVTLPESITTLGSSAFKGTALTSINIPQSLTSIGDDAFLDCTSLNTVNVNSADQFKAISFGGSAFNNVYNLYNNGSIIELDLSIAEGTTSINDTYSYCGSLKRLTIPSSVKTIAASAFYECTNLTEINYNATAVTSSNSNIFYNAGKNGSGITVNIASSVTSIPNYLFYTNGTSGNWPKVKALNIANDSALTSIGTRAFYGFAEITHITIPEKVTSIGSSAFANANALTEINYNAKALTTSLSQSSDIFYNAGRIASGITVNIGASVTSIPAYLFYVNTSHYCPNIKTVNFSENVTSIGNWAFRDLTGITSITIPEKVTSIGDYAFAGCASLTEITLPFVGNGSDKTSFGSIFGTVPTSLKTVTIIGGIIANDAFRDCSNIQSITLSDGVTGIGNYAFDGCTALTSITIPNSITSIGNYAFMDCSSLTSITIPSSVTSIGDNAFYYCTALTSVTIPDSVTSIGDRAFEFCARLTSIIIPNSVTSIGVAAFGSCEALTSITIPNSITRIERLTFCNCKALTSITIPNSITSIGTSAFEGCLALTSLELPDSLTYIGVYAFGSVPEGLMTTVDEIKYICSVTGKKLILIDATSFTGNSFSVPEECLAIYDQAFKGCTSLSSIIIAEGVTSIGSNAFCGCTALTSITIPNSVTSIDVDAFEGCVNISFNVSEDHTEWSSDFQGALYNKNKTKLICGSGVESFIVPDTVTSIGTSAFKGYKNLTSVTIPSSVTSISDFAFYGCTGLTSITIPSSVTSIPSYAFCGCTALTTVDLTGATNLTSINYNAFRDCTALTSITIPPSVTYIGSGAFYNCKNLKTIVVEAHEGATEVTSCQATLPTISGYTWYVYEGDSTEGTQVTTNYIQYSNVKYTYKAVANS